MASETTGAAPDGAVARLRAFADGQPWVVSGDLYGTLRADLTLILDALAAAQARERADAAALDEARDMLGECLMVWLAGYQADNEKEGDDLTALEGRIDAWRAALAARRAAATGAGDGEEGGDG